jgi:hypothetical protein
MTPSHIHTIDEAATGLAKWGTEVFGANPHFDVHEWRPTVANIDAAADDGLTWDFESWERATGGHGLVGIHTALNSCGWNIVLSRVQTFCL